MLDLDKSSSGSKPKCLFTSTQLAKFLDHEQPPTKKRPFSTVLEQIFNHTLHVLLPSSPTTANLESLTSPYAVVHLKFQDLLTNPFFTTYIKTPSTSSNILLLSQDNAYFLHDGILHLELDKSTYEKTGLQGKAIPSDGRKHVKAKFLVEINLRLPSMVHGKPGFERVLWAAKNVLNETITWLFYPGSVSEDVKNGPIKNHAPIWRNVRPSITDIQNALVPELQAEDEEDATELLEWLSLAMNLCSPRVNENDKVDPYLCRYQVPNQSKTQDLLRLRWHGLIPPGFAYKIFLAALKATGNEWMSISATSFTGQTYSILVHDGKALTWEYKD